MENKHPFISFAPDVFRILKVTPCGKEFLFHSSAKDLTHIDPQFNTTHSAYNSKYEYGIPVVYASDKPSNAFCYEPTELYIKTKQSVGTSVYHRLIHKHHQILLGAKLRGYIYVLSGKDFYEITREDFEAGEWVQSIEWISTEKIFPVDKIKIVEPYDWEMIPEYEFLGIDHVGTISVEKYLSLAKDEVVKSAILEYIHKPFKSVIPEGLKKYL